MGCNKCGCPTPRSRLCKQCAIEERYSDQQERDDDSDDEYECSQCGTVFVPEGGLDPCPECGSFRHTRVNKVVC